MGTEMLVALGALTLAAAAVIQSLSLSRRLQQTEFRALQDSRIRDEWQQRLDGLEMVESGQPVFERDPNAPETERRIRQLDSTVQVLELRALEHDSLLRALITEDEALHLWNVSRNTPTIYERHPGVESELRSLVRRGLLKKKRDFKIHELDSSFDLLRYFQLTDTGEILLSLRKHLEETDRSIKDSLPPRLPEHGYDLDSLDLRSPTPELRILP